MQNVPQTVYKESDVDLHRVELASVLEDVKCVCNDERGMKKENTSPLRSSEFQAIIFHTEHFRNFV